MQFILQFLKKVLTGEPDLVKCANTAYEKTLKQYHNFLVKGIFNVSTITTFFTNPLQTKY